MKSLLILGAGAHGQVVKEIAIACGYEPQKIAFLDDNAPNVVGKISDAPFFVPNYDGVIVAIGNNALRHDMTEKIDCLEGINIITLIHPTAYVSPSAIVGKGTVIEPNAVINANSKIGEGSIISVGTIIDHNSSIGSFSHINTGAICMAGSKVEKLTKVNVGNIVKGF